MIRNASASQIPPGHLILTGGNVVGMVIERGEPIPDAQDQSPTVRVFVLSGDDEGTILALGGFEFATDLGKIKVAEVVPTSWLSVSNK